MKDIRNAAIFVIATAFAVAVPGLGKGAVYLLLPGLIWFFWPVMRINPHGGTLTETFVVLAVGFVVNVAFYALVFAGIRKMWARA